MIELDYIKFQNIGRFVEMQHIDFSNKGRLLQFDGKNENTGGSSGSGKSTVFNAIDLLFGVNDLPVSSLQSRLTKGGFYVEGGLKIWGVPVVITRSKKDGLVVKTPTETVEGNSKLSEEKLDSLIKIPRHIFKKMIHKAQKSGGFFLELSAKESYSFMIECLGLNDWEEKSTKLQMLIKNLEVEIATLSVTEEKLKIEIESSRPTIQPPEPLDVEATEKSIKEMDGKIQLLSVRLESVLSKSRLDLEAKLAQLPADSPQPVFEGAEQEAELNAKLRQVNADEIEKLRTLDTSAIDDRSRHIRDVEISHLGKLKVENEHLVKATQSLLEQKRHIQSSSCPTCSQSWTGESAEQKIAALTAEIEKNKANLIANKIKIDTLPALTGELAGLEFQKEELLKQQQAVKLESEALRQSIKNKIAGLRSEFDQKLLAWKNENHRVELKRSLIKSEAAKELAEEKSLIEGQIENAKFLRQSNASLLSNYKSNLQYYELAVAQSRERLEKAQNTLSNTSKELAAASTRLKVAQEAQRAIKTYTLQVFQDTLDFIGQYATQILNAVPAMANATLFFENCKETKTGKIKDEINCVINVDGENDINIKTLSGGERTAVDMAVDLAVIEVLETQLGIGANFIILDEPFTGLDAIGCEAVVDIIKQIGMKKRIIIVDHNESVKQIIDETITVNRKGSESSITQ